MRKKTFLLVSILLVLIFASCATAGPKPETPHGHVTDWKEISLIPTANGCYAMEGFDVVEGMGYSIKIESGEQHATLYKTDLSTGRTTLMKTYDADGKLTSDCGSVLCHANDMCGIMINGRVNLFVSTMKSGKKSNALVRLVVDSDSTYRVCGNFGLSGATSKISGLDILDFDGRVITFLGKNGKTFYIGKMANTQMSGTIEMTEVAVFNSRAVQYEGQVINLDNCINQGYAYKDGILYIPVTSENYAETYVMVFRLELEEGKTVTLYPLPDMTMHMVDNNPKGTQFEIESIDYVPETDMMYFNTNRKSLDGVTRDAVHSLYYPLTSLKDQASEVSQEP